MSWDASDEDTWERWIRRALGAQRAVDKILAEHAAAARDDGRSGAAGETVAACSEGREAPSLNRWGRCVACDQPPGSNPNRCFLCADVYDKEHP